MSTSCIGRPVISRAGDEEANRDFVGSSPEGDQDRAKLFSRPGRGQDLREVWLLRPRTAGEVPAKLGVVREGEEYPDGGKDNDVQGECFGWAGLGTRTERKAVKGKRFEGGSKGKRGR